MTGKELMYVDDALGHLTHFKTLCDDYTKKIKDPSLKAFVNPSALYKYFSAISAIFLCDVIKSPNANDIFLLFTYSWIFILAYFWKIFEQ